MQPGTIIEKTYARRSIEGYKSPYNDPFTYKSVAELGEECVIELLLPFVDNLDSLAGFAQSRVEFQALAEHAGSAYRPENWLIAYLNEAPIGATFPTRWWDHLEGGSITLVAVLPVYQGKGYGKILHAKGLEILASIGVLKYVGSTATTNTPMLRIFERNGCELGPVRKFRVDERGMHVPIPKID